MLTTTLAAFSPREESKSSGDAGGAAKVRPGYYLLKAASESLEAYLKLNPEQSEQAFWSEQLETLRFYARNLDNSDPDNSVTGLTATLRPTILYREKALRKIRFTPAMRDGKPLSLIGILEFTFKLY